MTLTDFLLARIGDDEVVAKAATAGPWATQTMAGNLVYGNPEVGEFVCDTGLAASERVLDDALHIARHNPARVLAECAAKRRIVELHADAGESQGYTGADYGYIDHCCGTCGTFGEYGEPWPCATFRALALPYANHPDYSDEWLP